MHCAVCSDYLFWQQNLANRPYLELIGLHLGQPYALYNVIGDGQLLVWVQRSLSLVPIN